MKRIYQLIEKGEGEMLDFKKEITSVYRIAKTIVSFANQFGGILLIGVNDNGTISGIKPEEERFMLKQASDLFCHPPIELGIHEWDYNGKIILEVIIPLGINKPYYAIDEVKKRWVYIRQKDQTLLASKMVVDIMRRQYSTKQTLIKYSSNEKAILDYLKSHPKITLDEYCKLIKVSRWRAIKILVNLVSVGIIRLHQTEHPEYFTLS